MKLPLLCLLLALICTSQVLSLQCIVGNGDEKPQVDQLCPPNKTFCKTEYRSDNSIIMSCAERCVQTYEIACCQQDMCIGDTL